MIAAASIGVAAIAAAAPVRGVTTWNWSFSSPLGRSGSDTFTTADVTPTANVDVQVTGITSTNLEGQPISITSLNSNKNNIFCWDGTSPSPLLTLNRSTNSSAGVSFTTKNGDYFLQSFGSWYAPINVLSTPIQFSPIDTSSVQPVFAPAAVPGPLPLFGAAAAFGASRRLRHRIKLHKSSQLG